MGQITQVNPEALNVASQMILKEIDLTGTDADRKAKLDQFEADWKALTGSDTLDGARFVGRLPATSTGQNNVLLTYNWADGEYKGLCSDDSYVNSSVSVSTTNGSLTITPLFSHLEAVVLRISDGDSNADTVNAANKASIENYVANLQSLGVSIEGTPCHFILLKYKNGNYTNYTVNVGILRLTEKYSQYDFWIDGVKGGVDYETGKVTISSNLNTTLEAITIYTDNTEEHMQANLDNIAAYEANLQALGVDTTKSPMIPIHIPDDDGIEIYSGFVIGNPSLQTYYSGYIEKESTPGRVYKGILIDGGLVYLTTFADQNNVVDKSLNVKSLESVVIYTDNTIEHKSQNIKNIQAYEANLKSLGVDTANGFEFLGLANGYNIHFVKSRNSIYQFFGIQTYNKENYTTWINTDGRYTESSFSNLYTSRSLNAKSLEAVTIKTSNSDADKAANMAAIKAYVDNLKSLGVDVTKGYMVPITIGDKIGYMATVSRTLYRGLYIYDLDRTVWFSVSSVDGTYSQRYVDFGSPTSNLTTTSKQIVGAINEVNAAAKGVKALGAIELKADDKAANKTALAAFLKVLTDAGIDTSNGYSTPIRITGNSQEYFGTLNIGTGTLLSGVVTDINESHHYPCNVNISDGELTFSETNYFLEKTSNEVVEMLDAIKYSHTPVPFTETTLSNKAQLEVFLSKVPDAQVMHCTYKGVYAGTLHKINGDWYGMLVKNTNDYADNLNVKLQADGTLIEGTTSVQSINAQLDAINGEVK